MATKLDKETLIKHRFWFLLPVVVLLWLFAFICISGVSSATEKNWSEADKVNKDLKKLPTEDLRNDNWIRRMEEEKVKAQNQKLDLWYDVYDKQNGISREKVAEPKEGEQPDPTKPKERGKPVAIRVPFLTWPRSPRGEIAQTVQGKNFGEALGNVPNEYKDPTIFLKQYEDLIKVVDPLDEKTGKGGTRFGAQGNSAQEQGLALLRPLEGHMRWGEKPVLSEEAWLAQEEFAVKRDLFHIVREINGILSDLQPEWREVSLPVVAPAAPAADAAVPPAGEAKPADAAATLDRKRFLNTTWQFGSKEIKEPQSEWFNGWIIELELLTRGNQVFLEGTSTNLSQTQKLPAMQLAVMLSDDNPRRAEETLIIVEVGDLPPTKPDPARQDPSKKLSTEPTMDLAANYAKDIADLKASTRVIKINLTEATKGWTKQNPRFNPQTAFKKIAGVKLPAAPPKVLDYQRFTNNNWVVEVMLMPKDDGSGQVMGLVHNKSGRRMLPVNFKVITADVRNQEFAAEIKLPLGTAFDAHTSKEFGPQIVSEGRGTPVRIAGVQQSLDFRTVPVKRIDRLEMGAVAHAASDRTAANPKFSLKAYNFGAKDPTAQVTPTAPTDTTQQTPANTGTPDGSGGATASQASGNTPNHALIRARYVEVTAELRRIPVAMVLVIDQAHINDAILAFSNSKMRIQPTMVVWNRVPGLPRPAFIGEGAEKPAAAAPTGQPVQKPSGPIAEQSNLVELQLYGLATIYENPDQPPPASGTTPPIAGR